MKTKSSGREPANTQRDGTAAARGPQGHCPCKREGWRSHRDDDDEGRDRSLIVSKIEMMSEISIPDFGTLPLTQNRRYKVFEAKSRMCVTSTLRVKVLISSAHPPLESRQRLADASKNLAKLRLMRAEKITFLSTPMCIRMLRSPASARRVKGPSLASATLSAIIYYCTSVCADDEELYHK